GHEDAFPRCEHLELFDGLGHLVAAQLQEVVDAEVCVVTTDVDDSRLTTDATLHREPPEITGRISTSSSSSRRASPGTRVPPRITSTDSRLRSSFTSSEAMVMGP